MEIEKDGALTEMKSDGAPTFSTTDMKPDGTPTFSTLVSALVMEADGALTEMESDGAQLFNVGLGIGDGDRR